MTSTFAALFTAEAATLSATFVVDTTADQGFGSDLSCTDDIDAAGTELSGDDPRCVSQACYRRLTTQRGTVVDDLDYGFDLTELLELGMTRVALSRVPGMVRAELMKDDRVESVLCTVSNVTSESFDLNISGTCAKGPFTLTVALSDAGALLKEMTP